MIDRSDPITGQQAQRITQIMKELKNDAPFAERFDIYTFEGDAKNVMEPILSVCSVGRPEDANEWIENPVLVRRRYEDRFSSVLDRTIEQLLHENTLDNSPIIESIKAAAITSFGMIEERKTRLRLTLISDMVQHSALFSQFRAESNFAQLARTPTWVTMMPNLRGAQVDILYLLRPSARRLGIPIQSRGHQLFWEQLIQAANGRLDKLEPI
jgi:hypothetical protein